MNDDKVKKANYFIVCLMFLSYGAIMHIKTLNIYNQVSLLIVTGMVLFTLIAIGKIDKFSAILIGISVIFAVISIIITNGGMGSVLTFVMAMLVLNITTHGRFSNKQCNCIAFVSLIVLLVTFFHSFGYNHNWLYYLKTDINPNTLGMFLMFTYMIWYCTSKQCEKNFFKVYAIVLCLISMYGMINLRSRGEIMALAVFIILNILPKKILNSKTTFMLSILITVIGTMFPFLFLSIYRKGINFVILGKSLYTGREKIWNNMFEAFGNDLINWVFGLGSKVELWENHNLNVHNDYFAKIVNFGVVGYSLFEIYIFRYIKSACILLEDCWERRCWLFMFISSALFLGLIEVVTYWSVIFVLIFMGLGIAQNSYERWNDKL